ncbi:MAG: hypothetical protein HDS50_02830 [Bacteroides sp.]|nr:hypothetical protein [Bacteroides sp.]MDE5835510.1 hypothetical protein [Paramuribaculum sp.]
MAAKKRKQENESPNLIVRIRSGQIISSDFFAHNWLSVFTCVMVIMFYITNKYNCQTKMEEINRLRTELEIVKTERLRVRSTYMSNSRESYMQHLIDSLGLNLHVQERPPFKLEER